MIRNFHTIHYFLGPPPERDPISPCFLGSLEPSVNPPFYCSSPLIPAQKHPKLDTGHWSSISDRHQHKRYMLTDLPPSSEEEERPSGITSWAWLPPCQSQDKSLPEFGSWPHQYYPTGDEQSTFRPPTEQRQSTCIPVPRIFPDNTYGDRPPIEIKQDMSRGLDTIQEEPSQMDTIPMNEEDLGQIYSSKWMRSLFNVALGSGSIPKHYQDILKLSKEEQELWMIAMWEEIHSLDDHKIWMLVNLPKGRKSVVETHMSLWLYQSFLPLSTLSPGHLVTYIVLPSVQLQSNDSLICPNLDFASLVWISSFWHGLLLFSFYLWFLWFHTTLIDIVMVLCHYLQVNRIQYLSLRVLWTIKSIVFYLEYYLPQSFLSCTNEHKVLYPHHLRPLTIWMSFPFTRLISRLVSHTSDFKQTPVLPTMSPLESSGSSLSCQ